MYKLKSNAVNLLVSVIVPAYNVEKYIDKCLSSILAQTYRNIEIIVVDDGSTDSTRKIVNEISQRDSRVHAIYKTNAGVSAARNSGINRSHGEYLIFVDGDDYIATDCVEYMLNLVEHTGSEFCLSKNCYTKSGEKQTTSEYIDRLKPEDATALLLSPDIVVGCWNKIFKRSLLVDNNLEFSTKLFYGEGLSFITTASQLSNSVGVGNRKVYYYRRNNENSATTKFNIEKLINGEKALENIKKHLMVDSKEITTMYNLHRGTFYLGAVVKLKTFHLEKKYSKEYKRWNINLRLNAFKLMTKKEISLYRRIMLLGGCISPWVMMKLDSYRRQQISENSVE